ncbi:MAG: hemerythrin domain-containing protein [Alphaproteobacteria bacterium]
MDSHALTIIQREHRAVAAVLHCFEHILNDVKAGKLESDFPLYEAIIDYIQDFPDRFHHPKEDNFLFKTASVRARDLQPVIDDLKAQHVAGERKIADLRWKLEAYKKAPKDAWAAFDTAARAYIDFQRKHIGLEERAVIPTARRLFDAADWAPIERAYADNDDPIFGRSPRNHFDRLFSRIVALAPQPHGLAERREPKSPGEDESKRPEFRSRVVELHWL